MSILNPLNSDCSLNSCGPDVSETMVDSPSGRRVYGHAVSWTFSSDFSWTAISSRLCLPFWGCSSPTQWLGGLGKTLGDGGSLNLAPAYTFSPSLRSSGGADLGGGDPYSSFTVSEVWSGLFWSSDGDWWGGRGFLGLLWSLLFTARGAAAAAGWSSRGLWLLLFTFWDVWRSLLGRFCAVWRLGCVVPRSGLPPLDLSTYEDRDKELTDRL